MSEAVKPSTCTPNICSGLACNRPQEIHNGNTKKASMENKISNVLIIIKPH